MHNLLRNVKITRVSSGLSASTTDHNCTAVDMRGFEGVAFVASFGALTTAAVTFMKGQEATSSGATYSDLLGTAVNVDDQGSDLVALLDIFRPKDRWVRAVIDRGTANAVVDSVVAMQYRALDAAVTHSTATVYAAEYYVSPATGDAT